jgi:formiminotetrahydrofolate cyclodeaminase
MGEELLRLADEDARAFTAFMAAWRSTKGMEPGTKRTTLSAAARISLEPPRTILACCRVVAVAGERLAGRSNLNLASDLMCASRAVEAAAHCAAENVLVNLSNLTDRAEAETLRAETRRTVADVERLARATRRTASSGLLRTPEPRSATDGELPGIGSANGSASGAGNGSSLAASHAR